jgi:hypothetical protein
MAPARRGDLTASMVILGLIVKQSDTAAGVSARLVSQFPSARWPRTTSHKGLSALLERGFVRIIDADEGTLDRYEATRQGEVEFTAWLRASPAMPPALRDAIHIKLALCEDQDLSWFIGVIREQERACLEAGEAAQVRLNRASRSGQLGPAGAADIKSRVPRARMTHEVRLWDDMSVRLRRFREDLEGVEYEVGTPGGSDGG